MWRFVRDRPRDCANERNPVVKYRIGTFDAGDILVSFGHRRYVDDLVPLYDPRMDSSER